MFTRVDKFIKQHEGSDKTKGLMRNKMLRKRHKHLQVQWNENSIMNIWNMALLHVMMIHRSSSFILKWPVRKTQRYKFKSSWRKRKSHNNHGKTKIIGWEIAQLEIKNKQLKIWIVSNYGRKSFQIENLKSNGRNFKKTIWIIFEIFS